MITAEHVPEKAIDAARLAMAEALMADGDGIPECIVAALMAWPGMQVKLHWRTFDEIHLPFVEPVND